MANLDISFFGSFEVTLKGLSRISFATDKARALLAYLVVESGRPHRRASLAALFWPDRPEAKARNNLRQAIFQLRRALGDCQDDPVYLLLRNEDVQFNPHSDHWLDVAEFNKHIAACRAHHPEGLSLCESCRERLQRAVDLYQGEFLAGFSLPDCLGFDLWQVITQETYHSRALEALTRLSAFYESRRQYDLVLEYSRRQIELEPWREPAYRCQMRALALRGQIGQALLQYAACCEILSQEFGILPSQETVSLFEQIQAGKLDKLIERGEASRADRSWRPVAQPQRVMLARPGRELAPRIDASPYETLTASPRWEESVLAESLDHTTYYSLRGFSTQALLNLFSHTSIPDESKAYLILEEALCALTLEIHKLHAGQVISASQLRRLRKALCTVIATSRPQKHRP